MRGRTTSGTRLVLGLVLVVLAVWCGLYLTFRAWRGHYRELAAFGRREVPPALDPLRTRRPAGIPAGDWGEAIDATEGLVRRIVGANLLDRAGLIALRDHLAARAQAAEPGTAVAALAGIWADLERHAGPIAARAERPNWIEPALTLVPVADRPPPGVDPGPWRRRVAELQGRSAVAVATGRSPWSRDPDRRARWIERVRAILREPATAPDGLHLLESEWVDAGETDDIN